ncbi:ABC transporter permease [Paenibacillus sp. LS1]|uniref:ABC transporter permease n=1 Tax=Paenibacillus sp. LS1 TaxID=2992120 RepID=UPI00223286C8|nr:ABC transporter permease [Paenibacillus sp. LS1]MCW3793937.1 ABC transporter permease [Paenibacillus sp. LS1]
MNNASSALKVAAGIFLTIALITIVVLLFVSAQEATKTAQNNFSDIQRELSQATFTVYDSTTVSGNQVLNALRKYSNKDQFGIQVITGKNATGAWYNNMVNLTTGSPTYGAITTGTATGTLAKASDEASNDYVNPSGNFESKIVYDGNNVVRGITFVQK